MWKVAVVSQPRLNWSLSLMYHFAFSLVVKDNFFSDLARAGWDPTSKLFLQRLRYSKSQSVLLLPRWYLKKMYLCIVDCWTAQKGIQDHERGHGNGRESDHAFMQTKVMYDNLFTCTPSLVDIRPRTFFPPYLPFHIHNPLFTLAFSYLPLTTGTLHSFRPPPVPPTTRALSLANPNPFQLKKVNDNSN